MLIELDDLERAQAIEARNEEHAATARALLEKVADANDVVIMSTLGVAASPEHYPEVRVDIVLDVSEQALVGAKPVLTEPR